MVPSMPSERTVLELLELIYRAAGDPHVWASVLEHLAKAVRGEMGSLHHQRGPDGESNFSSDWNVDPQTIALYMSYYGFRNPLMTVRPEALQAGKVNTTQTLCGDEIFLRSEYYNDFLRHRDWCQCLAATLLRDGVASTNITIFRAVGAEAFGERECKLMQMLMPHLQRAFQLHNRIEGLERKGSAVAEALDHSHQGVILLDSTGRALVVNQVATAIFAGEKNLRLTSRGLVAAIPSENRQLGALIQAAITTAKGNGISSSGGAMAISRNDLRRPLQVLVIPLRTRSIYLGKDIPVVAVFVSDPERKGISESRIVAQLYGLTPAESRLAQSLATGNSLKEASEELGVAESTARSQLKSIFSKTNTNRQSELVRLFLTAPTI